MSGQDDSNGRPSPWAWLRGFAYFLVAWPVLGLMAADELQDEPWSVILPVYLGPPAIGLILLGVDGALTRLLGEREAFRGSPAPALIRDLSNLGLCMAVLLLADVVLVLLFEETPFDRAPNAPRRAVLLLACFLGPSLALRVVHGLIHGGRRDEYLGAEWDYDQDPLHLMGYLTLIPTLLVTTVMIDHALNDASEFGLRSWIALPAILLLGLRSAMARAPAGWARNPWEASLRQVSLNLPWWAVAWLTAVAVGVLMVLTPFGLGDEAPSLAGRIFCAIFLAPAGLAFLAGAALLAYQALPNLARRVRAFVALIHAPNALVGWQLLDGEATHVGLELRDGRTFTFALSEGDDPDPILTWLRRHPMLGRPHGGPPETGG